ncbi:MAG: RnfABCDGE type electron transport complex subunit D [Betaproteobacteria bacterium]|nr:RnfABCDGE type electron transport complex subunit D [Betaproteobacteria bacterium]
MNLAPAPFFLQDASVGKVMRQVCLALLPGIAAYVWLIGPAILLQLLIASLAALLAEAVMLRARGKPLGLFLADGSAIVTAWLIALSFPPLAPWWLVATGAVFAIVIAKHLYGGLGQNPFNPAMVAFAACIVAFPALMSQWPHLGLAPGEQFAIILGLAPRLDALTGATPLDALKTGLTLGGDGVDQLLAKREIYGQIAGRGWEWVAAGYLLGGLWLWRRRIIAWQAPLAFIGTLAAIAGILWLHDPVHFANPLFHLFSGSAMLGAFFIVTDPVSGCATPRGRLIFGAGAGLLAYIIRVFGGYPDGIAFAVLLMNLCAPLIDRLCQPSVFGLRDRKKDGA